MKPLFSVPCAAALALLLCSPASAQEFDSGSESGEEPSVEIEVKDAVEDAAEDVGDPAEVLDLEVDDIAAEGETGAETGPEPETEAGVDAENADAAEAPAVEETVVVEVPDGDAGESPAEAGSGSDEEPPDEPPPAEETAPSAPVAEDGEPLVSMAFEQSTLEDVVAAFRTQTGANIVNGWTNQFSQLVSVRLDDVPWTQGLSSILVPYGLQLREEPRGSHIYIVAEPRLTAPPRFTEALELKHLEAPEVAKLFAGILPKDCLVYGEPSANVVIVKATDDQINECKAILAKIDKPSPQVYIEARFVRLSAGASKKLGLKWDSLENFGVSLSHLSGGFSMSDGKLSTFGIQNDARVSSAAVGDTFSHSTLDDVESRSRTLTRETASAVSSGSYRTTANSTVSDDSVSITLNDSTLANLTANDLGYRRTAGFGGQLSVTDFGLVMSAFEQLDGAQVFSNPKIIVRNGKTAVVDMTTKYPNIKIDYQQSTESGQRDSISSSLATIPGKTIPWVGEAFFSYGITLEVTPTVSPNGLITVEIIPTISERAGTKTVYVTSDSSIGNDYPIIALRRLDTKFTMEDGKTAVIGGLTETSEKTVDSGIPLLRHIPWIGPRLFGWKSREKSQDEILVFVTVRVADPATNAVDGLPKNAVLGRMMMDGRIKEPGDRTDNEMGDLASKPVGYAIK
jgi:type II secretory pathway component GspD/PulD (secretin)